MTTLYTIQHSRSITENVDPIMHAQIKVKYFKTRPGSGHPSQLSHDHRRRGEFKTCSWFKG